MLAIAAVAALVPFVIDALWLLRHPDAYIDTLGRWAIHPEVPLQATRCAIAPLRVCKSCSGMPRMGVHPGDRTVRRRGASIAP